MSDREQTIATLTEHLDHWKRLLSEGICTKDEGERTIDALNFAIESIKVDRAYDLMYEKVDFIEIPEGATKGNIFQAVFGWDLYTFKRMWGGGDVTTDWWNSPFRKEQE